MQSINLQGKNAAELAELKKASILDQKVLLTREESRDGQEQRRRS